MKTYHIGIVAGDKLPYGMARNATTLYLQVRRSVDYLSSDLWIYYGERETTKARLKTMLPQLLVAINKEHGTTYARMVME